MVVTFHLSDAACQLLGLVPGGPVEPQVYGIQPLKRSQGGWSFRVVERWRIGVVRDVLWDIGPSLSTPCIAYAAWRTLGSLR